MNNDILAEIQRGITTAFIDKNAESSKSFQPQFISNDYREGKKVLSSIEGELLSCDQFFISVAFITLSGIEPLLQILKVLEKRGVKGQILTTDYLSFSEPNALKKLHTLSNIEVRMFRVQGGNGFHTKGYIFRKSELYKIIVGSSNLTAKALTENKEWNTKILSTANGEYADQLLAEFEALWNDENSLSFDAFFTDYEQRYRNLNSVYQAVKDASRTQGGVGYSVHEIQPNSMQRAFLKNLNELQDRHQSRALLISATGTGKTYASAFAARQFNPRRMLFLVHREQVAKKAMESYRKVINNGRTYGLLSGTSKETNADYIFSTIQTISKDETLHQFAKNAFDLIIVDAYGIIGLNSKDSTDKGFLKLSPILFSPQKRLMVNLRRKHAQNEDLSAKRSAACNFGSTVSDVVPSHLLQRQSAEHTPDVDLHRSTVRYPKDVSLACAA